MTLKEVYLKERVAALEAELSHARSGAGAVSSKEVRFTPTASDPVLCMCCLKKTLLAKGGVMVLSPLCCGVLWVLLQVDQLRAEVARYQARLAELENDFLSLDVVANTEVRHHVIRHTCMCCIMQA